MDSKRARIPAEEMDKHASWEVPPIHSKNIVETARSGDRQGYAERVEDYEDELKLPTAEEIALISIEAKKHGFEAGFKVGFGRGEEKAFQQTRQRIDQETNRRFTELSRIAAVLINAVKEQDNALEGVLIRLVIALSEAVIRDSLSKDIKRLLPKIVEQALDSLPQGSGNIAIYLNADDCQLMQTYAEQSGAFPADWNFLPATDMQPGDCHIETKDSIVDFDCEARARQVYDAVFGENFPAEVQPMEVPESSCAEDSGGPLEALKAAETSPGRTTESGPETSSESKPPPSDSSE